MPENGAILAKPAPSFRANLRTGLTYAAFTAGHIWAAFSVLVLAGITHSASLDWPLAIENGWTGQLIFSGLLIAALAAHAALVIWLIYNCWRVWRRGALTLARAARPLVTLSALFVVVAAIWVTYQYWDWQSFRHATTGSILFRCQEIDENYDLHPSDLSFKHVRKETWDKSEWYIKMSEQPYRVMKPIKINTNFIHGSFSFQWLDERGVEMVAVMSSTTLDGMQDYGWKMETVDIGPAATVPLDWEVEGGRELAAAWVEQEFHCDAEIASWRPD